MESLRLIFALDESIFERREMKLEATWIAVNLSSVGSYNTIEALCDTKTKIF